jgi:hypothetical protein
MVQVVHSGAEELISLQPIQRRLLGCLQIALEPEAVRVAPEPYFPEVLELVRQHINQSIRKLEYEEIRRLIQSSVSFLQ